MNLMTMTLSATQPLRASFVRDAHGLEESRAAIEDLAYDTEEPNFFYETWVLILAMATMGAGLNFEFLLLYEEGPQQRLCAFFPFIRSRLHQLVPIPALQLWHHPHCSRCTPLIRRGYSEAAWTAVFNWIESPASGRPLLDMIWVPADGEVGGPLERTLATRRRLISTQMAYEAPFLRRAASCEEALAASMSKSTVAKRRQELRKLQKRGEVTFTDVDAGTDIDKVFDEFLALEAAGWKGREGTAIASYPSHTAFYREVVREAFRQGRLSVLQLRLDGHLLAARIMILTGQGSVVPKIAYDEAFHAFGPGSLLEMEEMRRMHDASDPLRKDLLWSDSVATQGGGPLARCWAERRHLRRYWIGASPLARLGVRLVPGLLWAQAAFGRLRARLRGEQPVPSPG